MYIDDKFSKLLKLYLGEDGVYNFVNSMIEENTAVMTNLKWLKKMLKIVRALLNVGFVIMVMLMVMLKQKIIIISLENREALHIETVISRLK